MIQCEKCDQILISRATLLRHYQNAHVKGGLKCPRCPCSFQSDRARLPHMVHIHNETYNTSKGLETLRACEARPEPPVKSSEGGAHLKTERTGSTGPDEANGDGEFKPQSARRSNQRRTIDEEDAYEPPTRRPHRQVVNEDDFYYDDAAFDDNFEPLPPRRRSSHRNSAKEDDKLPLTTTTTTKVNDNVDAEEEDDPPIPRQFHHPIIIEEEQKSDSPPSSDELSVPDDSEQKIVINVEAVYVEPITEEEATTTTNSASVSGDHFQVEEAAILTITNSHPVNIAFSDDAAAATITIENLDDGSSTSQSEEAAIPTTATSAVHINHSEKEEAAAAATTTTIDEMNASQSSETISSSSIMDENEPLTFQTVWFKCKLCGFRCLEKQSLAFHILGQHDFEKLTCTICSLRVSSPEGLELHYRNKHRPIINKNAQSLTTITIDMNLDDLYEAGIRVKSSVAQKLMTYLGPKTNFDAWEDGIEFIAPAPMVPKKDPHKKILKQQKRQQDMEESPWTTYRPKIKARGDAHKIRKAGKPRKEKKMMRVVKFGGGKYVKGSHECPQCGIIFTSVKSLQIHAMRSHVENGSFKCHICPCAFDIFNGLRGHLNKYHPGYKSRSDYNKRCRPRPAVMKRARKVKQNLQDDKQTESINEEDEGVSQDVNEGEEEADEQVNGQKEDEEYEEANEDEEDDNDQEEEDQNDEVNGREEQEQDDQSMDQDEEVTGHEDEMVDKVNEQEEEEDDHVNDQEEDHQEEAHGQEDEDDEQDGLEDDQVDEQDEEEDDQVNDQEENHEEEAHGQEDEDDNDQEEEENNDDQVMDQVELEEEDDEQVYVEVVDGDGPPLKRRRLSDAPAAN